MTDTHSAPFTGPLPAPMFDSGPQPAASPNTEPHPAPIFDTGPHPDPLQPQAFSESDGADTDAFLRSVAGHLEHAAGPAAVPAAVPATPVEVPGSYQYIKRWKFALLVAGVWLVAAAAGLGFYYWWYTALDKTMPVFGILLYLVLCMVGSLLVSMVTNRPQLTALAIALMAAPLASTFAAAVLHGAYYFEWIVRPAIG